MCGGSGVVIVYSDKGDDECQGGNWAEEMWCEVIVTNVRVCVDVCLRGAFVGVVVG